MSTFEFDETRRGTLKVLAGTSASLAAGCLGVVSVADALEAGSRTGTLADTRTDALPRTFSSVLFDLEMHIISSTGVVENSLLLKNNTQEPMHIARFRSDHIVFGNKYVSLKYITNHGPLRLEPMQTKAFQVEVAARDDAIPTDYVQADHCVTALSDECVDVHLGGFLVGSDVMVITRKQPAVDVML